MENQQADITQIGTSIQGKETLKLLTKELFWFKEQYPAIKFAISVAIKFDLDVIKRPLITSHAVGTLDPDQKLKRILLDLYPDEQPYRYAQILADTGLDFIDQMVNIEKWQLSNFL